MIAQHDYLSPEARELRRQDGTPPWLPHMCEIESLGEPSPDDVGPFAVRLRELWALRREIEGGG